MMAADGQLASEQKELLAFATTVLEISPLELNSLIDRLLDDA